MSNENFVNGVTLSDGAGWGQDINNKIYRGIGLSGAGTIASATTPDIFAVTTTGIISYTGTTTCTGFTAAPAAGASRVLVCAGAAVFTASANMLIDGVSSGNNLTCAANDLVYIYAVSTTQFRLSRTAYAGSSVSGSITASGYTQSTARLLGRTTAATGAIEEISVVGATFTAGVLTVSANNACDFRLTLTTLTAVTTADVIGATTVYCTPYKGKYIDLYDGTATWNRRTSAEFSLAIGTITSGKPYDVFCYDNATVPTLEFLVWTNDTTRATALALQDGVLVKSGATTRRYMGTFYTTATTTTEDSYAKRYLYNYYNRVLKQSRGTFSVDRATSSTTYVELNSEIRPLFLIGVAEDAVGAAFNGSATAGSVQPINIAIAFDGTSAQAGLENSMSPITGTVDCGVIVAGTAFGLAVGAHYATFLARFPSANPVTFRSDSTSPHSKSYLTITLPV